MPQDYSTRHQDTGGQEYSSRGGRTTMLTVQPGPPASPSGPQAQPPLMQPLPLVLPQSIQTPVVGGMDLEQGGNGEPKYRYFLTGDGLPVSGGASGTVLIGVRPGEPPGIKADIQGLRPVADPMMRPILWLIHDILVPADLLPMDQALLPKGVNGLGNQPGTIFTLDGNPPTYGLYPNTITVAVSPGSFLLQPGGDWQLQAALDEWSNQAFHPAAVLGTGVMADLHMGIPSGTAVAILTDLFMRPAGVHPELDLRVHYPQRLLAIARESGAVPTYLDCSAFTRAAVTWEGFTRSTPRLMPTRENCFLVSTGRLAT
ncbi:MAG: hypothetical protein ACM3XM_20185 [Mycobacterium leprae]